MRACTNSWARARYSTATARKATCSECTDSGQEGREREMSLVQTCEAILTNAQSISVFLNNKCDLNPKVNGGIIEWFEVGD